VIRAAILLVVALSAAGCNAKSDAPSGDQRPAPIAAPERQRGAEACKIYIERACACAKARPDDAEVKKRCELDAALPDAMNLALGIDDEPDVSPADVFRAQSEARKVMATCIQGVNWITTHGCK